MIFSKTANNNVKLYKQTKTGLCTKHAGKSEIYLVISSLDFKSIQVNHQLLPLWSTYLTISLEKQYTKFNSAHNMNNTSEMVTLSEITLNWVAPVKKCWILKWPKNKIDENYIIARGTLSSSISDFWP